MIPFRIERWMSAYEQNVKYNLAESGVKQLKFGELLDMAEKNGYPDIRHEIERLTLTYDETPGSERLRSQIAKTYGVGADEVLVTAGAIEANHLVFSALVEPGDVVVAMVPAYQQLYSLPEMFGANVRRWELRAEDRFRPDLDELKRLSTGKVKLIAVNTPNNPTGALLSEQDLRSIIALAEQVGAYVLFDETYQGCTLHEGDVVPPFARTLSDRAISVCTMSKTMGLAGLRIGWIVSTPELTERFWACRDYITICCSTLSDALASLAFPMRDALLTRCTGIARRNLRYLHDWVQANADFFEWFEPDAGLLAFPRLRKHPDSREFCRQLIKEESVLLGPGWAFDREGHVRIGIGEGSEVFDAGLEATARFLTRIR